MIDEGCLPPVILEHLQHMMLVHRKPAWAQINGDYFCRVGGAWQEYLDQLPDIAIPISEQLDCLQGMMPCADDHFDLSRIELRVDCYIDIHIFQHEETQWLLLLDISESVQRERNAQQSANELALARSKIDRILARHLGKSLPEWLVQDKLTFNSKGERKRISSMFVDIRDFTRFNEAYDPQEVISVLNIYFGVILPPILDMAGFIDKFTGDGLMALFGVHASTASPPENVLRAAECIQEAVRNLNISRQGEGLPVLKIGIGIATGEVVIGILGGKDRRAFSAIGHSVNLASRLEGCARADEILIDTETWHSTDSQSEKWQPLHLSLKGVKGIIHTYSYRLITEDK